jgi:AcrR family transcriptional regulator
VRHAGHRPLRADAERNRRLVLEAAAQAFAERGFDVGVAEIARRAGVGNATVFRRFPTKEALYRAIVEEKAAECVAAAQRAAEVDDPWEALVQLATATAEMQARDRGFFEATEDQWLHDSELIDAHRPILAAVDAIVSRAQEARVLRSDVTSLDIMGLVKGAVAAMRPIGGVGEDAWRRFLGLMLDGLRPQAATSLPAPPTSPAEYERAIASAAAPQRLSVRRSR